MNHEPLRKLAFSEPEGEKRDGWQKARYINLPHGVPTPAQVVHWSEVMASSDYFRMRSLGFSPRQIIAMRDWRIQ